MRLETLDYKEFPNDAREWKLSGLCLGKVNLLVGKNASGKTRTLNVIQGLAGLLASETKLVFSSGDYDVTFDNDGKMLRYVLRYTDSKVHCEELAYDGKTVLSRGRNGVGKILMEEKDELVAFQAPENELAAVVRRDNIQHKFLEPLNVWGKSVFHNSFGRQPQNEIALAPAKDQRRDTDKFGFGVIQTLESGDTKYGARFRDAIKADMHRIGYDLNDIGLRPPETFRFPAAPLGALVLLYVREKGLRCEVEQHQMSDGMFHALSLIIYFNYFELTRMPSCILIDDIGEGLDHERCLCLIHLLMDKAERTSVQLVMTSNDRFVMNSVPLEAWSVLQRRGGRVRVLNYANSKQRFDEFKLTGLNNFDFFATDFVGAESRSE